MRRHALRATIFVLLGGCDDGNEAEVRRLRAKVAQLGAERDRLLSTRDRDLAGESERAMPAGEAVPDLEPSGSPWKPEWRKVDLPAASIEFPDVPQRQTPTFEEWRARTGSSVSSERILGLSGSVLEYKFTGGGLDLAMAEVIVQGGSYLSLSERVDGFRAGILRGGPAEIVEEKSSKHGRFKVVRLELKFDGGMSAGLVAAAAKLRKDQRRFSPDALMYMAVAIWPTGGESAEVGKRFLDSLLLK